MCFIFIYVIIVVSSLLLISSNFCLCAFFFPCPLSLCHLSFSFYHKMFLLWCFFIYFCHLFLSLILLCPSICFHIPAGDAKPDCWVWIRAVLWSGWVFAFRFGHGYWLPSLTRADTLWRTSHMPIFSAWLRLNRLVIKGKVFWYVYGLFFNINASLSRGFINLDHVFFFFCKLHQEVSLLYLCFKRLDFKDYLCVQLLLEDTFQFASIIHITKAS